MIRRQKVEALVLTRQSVGEADRRLTLFTRQGGLLTVIAKGVRKIPSRRGGYLEPCTSIMAIVSGHSSQKYLAAVETISYYPSLHQDELAIAQASRLGGLVTQLFGWEEPQPRLYDALEHSWQILPTLAAPKRDLLEIAITLYALRVAGLMPDLAACQVCGEHIPREAIILDGGQGGWHCLLCHARLDGTASSVPPVLLRVLRFISSRPERALQLKLEFEASQQLVSAIWGYLQASVYG